ncbi:MAG: septum formation protein Maf [Planctomycetota bacterium]|nr:MAG: septum formation protein Maf [Planctomycetota bacterium]
MSTLRLVLASASPRRRELMAEAGYVFEVVVPRDSVESVECGICSSGGPAALVMELAASKAFDVAAQMKQRGDLSDECLIIACDTVAECRGEILGKPRDEAHARAMLEVLRGSPHRVYSGLCLWQPLAPTEASRPDVRLATSELVMDDISDDQLDEYLLSGLWRGKAGAFGYQDRPGWLHLTSGSESNVVGLPMELLHEMLAARGLMASGS